MKKIILTTLTAICIITNCFSQDVIIKRSGEEIQSKILELNPTEIKYKRSDNPDGPVFTILKSEVLMIHYENGVIDSLKEVQKTNTQSQVAQKTNGQRFFKSDLYVKGRNDAIIYYDSYKGAGTGTLVISLLNPIGGLISAITFSSIKPKEINLHYPRADLMNNPDYFSGYTKKAREIKIEKVWKNWYIAIGIYAAIVVGYIAYELIYVSSVH